MCLFSLAAFNIFFLFITSYLLGDYNVLWCEFLCLSCLRFVEQLEQGHRNSVFHQTLKILNYYYFKYIFCLLFLPLFLPFSWYFVSFRSLDVFHMSSRLCSFSVFFALCIFVWNFVSFFLNSFYWPVYNCLTYCQTNLVNFVFFLNIVFVLEFPFSYFKIFSIKIPCLFFYYVYALLAFFLFNF